MPTVKKLKLRTDYRFDFHLIGIMSKSKEYSVSWGINQALDIMLKKEEDLEIELKKGGSLLVSNFGFENDLLRFTLLANPLISGPTKTQKLLVPSLGHFDYFLKIEELEESAELGGIYGQLRNAEKVDTMVRLDVNKIKEKESFIF